MTEPEFLRTVPQVNNNGTSRGELISQRQLTRAAIRTAIGFLREQAPHGRDFQTVERERYHEARALYYDRLVNLQKIADDLDAEALAILHQR